MKKGLVTVFIVLGILVAGLLIWAFVFGDGFNSIYNAFATQINNVWENLTGSRDLLPEGEDAKIFGEGNNMEDAQEQFD